MGDRANFGFVQPNGHTIVLYGHWAGHNMLANLAEAVFKARPRWNDPSYAPHNDLDNKVQGMSNEPIFTMDLSNFVEKYADVIVSV